MASFPFSSRKAEVIAINRDLALDDEYTKEVGKSRNFELASADMIRNYVTAPNVSEGGVSISISDRKTLIGIANGIYAKHKEPLILEQRPTVTPVED